MLHITYFVLSCLPTWSKNDGTDFAYTWYLVVCGGLIPTLILVASNTSSFFAIHKVGILRGILEYVKLNYFKGLVRLKLYNLINYFPKSRKSGNASEVSKDKPFFGAHREIQLIMMTLSFIVSWAPFGMVYLVKLLGFREKGSHHKSDVLTLLCVKLGCGIITPIVCVFENVEVSFQDLINLGIITSGILIYL